MSLKDQIINGTYKKKNKTLYDQIIDGSYKSKISQESEKNESKPQNVNLPNTSTQAKTTAASLPINKNVSNLPIVKDLNKTKTFQENNLPILPVNTRPQQTSRTVTDVAKEFLDTTGKSTKTILTGVNYLGQAAMKGAEELADTAMDVATSNVNPYYWFNKDKLENHQNIVQEIIKKDATSDLITKLSGDEDFNKNFLDKDSLIKEDNLAGKVITSIGQMLPSIATGNPTAATTILGLQSYGGGVEEAYNNGANTTQARLYGLGNAAIELGTEKLFGGIPGTKTSGWLDNLVARGLGEKSFEEVSKSISKEIIKAGYKMVGEAGEEALAEIINPILKNATYSEGEKINWNNVLESAVIGGITGGILEAPSNIRNVNTAINNKNKVNLSTVDSTTSQNVNLPPVNNTETNLSSMKNENINLPTVKYRPETSDNSKINNLRQSAVNYFDNSQKTHDLVSTIEKVIADKDYNVIFDNTITNKKGESVNAQITNNNGQIEIKINPNSPRTGEFLLCHEITHAIETDSMKQLVMDYASNHSDFNKALESLKQTYGTNDVSDEVLADISGQLFGSQEFINSLSVKQPNIFKRIYNKIIELANKITGNSKEGLFIKDLKNKWEIAYRNTSTEQAISNLNNETKYAQKTLKDGTNYIETEKNLFTKEDGTTMSQREIYNSLVGKQITFNDGITATIKQWLPNNKNMYNELFKRYPNYKNVSNIKSVNENINENIVELLENSDNVSPNEPDYMDRHKDNKIDSFDTRKVSFFDGKDAYDLDFSIAKMQDGNYVAYAKRNLSANNELSNKIKKEAPTSKSRGVLPSADNIPQNSNNVKFDISSTKYSMQESSNNTKVDNQGRTLTKEQQEYFKDSKVRDENGNLLTVYHGTNNDFTIFDKSFIGKNTNNEGIFGKGFYFTEKKSLADGYNRKDGKRAKDGSGTTMELYLDMKNPFYWNSIDTKEKMETFIEEMGMPKYVLRWNNTLKNQMAPIIDIKAERKFSEVLQQNGYDGVVCKYEEGVGEYVVFNSNQIKNIKNINPTSNDDIRYSKQDNKWQEYVEDNYKATGTRTKFEDIKIPIAKENKINLPPVQTTNEVVKNDTKNNSPILRGDPTKESTYEAETRKTRKEVQNELIDEMQITAEDLSTGNDIKHLDMLRTDPVRLNEKVFGAKIGKKINDVTINKTKHNEAERIRFLNKERSDIEILGIKARSKESAAVQKYGEKKYTTDDGRVIKYGDYELARDFPNVETQKKIKKAASILRNKYDAYIDEINSVITNMGYDAIPKRTDYMRHFHEISDKLSQWGIPLNHDSLSTDTLPTDINGVTDQFKPGKNWFASTMHRTGVKTTYDAITGIDGYLEGASNLIYHTEDIQRYRALSKMIRETYGQTKGFENLDGLTDTQIQQRIKDIQNNKLSNYVAWLDEQANALAGKKGGIDRAAERLLGRKIYTILDTAKKQVGSNMTGFNVRSALTNFASSVMGASKTNKLAFIRGTISTMQNIIHNDGLINKSDFLTSRFGSKQLSKKLWQKASSAGQIFMTGSDYFTANQIWRSKYFENLYKGMNETEAIKNADDFSSRIMGDRSKGATAEIFNSKTLGLLTQFQLEVNNQWSSIIHDNKIDLQGKNKSGTAVVFQLGQLAAMSYMFNNLMKSLTGSGVMIDPIDLLMKMFDDDEKTTEEKATEVIGEIVNNIPFASVFTGGRIPISEAFTGAGTFIKKMTNQTDSYGNEIKWEDVKDDLISSAFYWLLPTGYGQIKKTSKGLSMYDTNLPIAGSYTDNGNLRFTADESTGDKIKAALFGQYSSNEAQKYIDSGYKTINKNRITEMKQLNMSSSEYRDYRNGLTEAGKTNEDKIDYIVNLKNVTNKQKNIMASNLLSRNFDVKEYDKYNSYDEYNYAYKYPEKYSIITQITDYDSYNKYNEELKNIRANTTNDKIETIKYINSLKLSIPQKAMYVKMYYSSYTAYDKQIVEYINKQKMTIDEKKTILQNLGFKFNGNKVIY